jgi:hypothetical protein
MHEVSFQRIDLCDLVASGCQRVEDYPSPTAFRTTGGCPVSLYLLMATGC